MECFGVRGVVSCLFLGLWFSGVSCRVGDGGPFGRKSWHGWPGLLLFVVVVSEQAATMLLLIVVVSEQAATLLLVVVGVTEQCATLLLVVVGVTEESATSLRLRAVAGVAE